jgi:hypothetical protein
MTKQWSNIGIVLLRDLINDVSDTPTYDDTRLQSLLLSAAYLNIQNIDFSYEYTVNLLTQDISPDPPESEFISLMVLRAVYMIAESEWKTESRKGITLRDGPTSISMADSINAKRDYAIKTKEQFDKAVVAYKTGNYNVGEAIVGAARFDLTPSYITRFY